MRRQPLSKIPHTGYFQLGDGIFQALALTWGDSVRGSSKGLSRHRRMRHESH